MAGDKVIQLSDADFETEVLKADMPVLVDFGLPGVPPAKPSLLLSMNWLKPLTARSRSVR